MIISPELASNDDSSLFDSFCFYLKDAFKFWLK